MANIRVDVPRTVYNGSEVVFLAPCDCSIITGLSVYYPDQNKQETVSHFVFRDAHGFELSDVDDLFTKGVYVKVILNVTDGFAYIQNADTNKYLEEKFKGYVESSTLTQKVKGIVLSDILVIG